MGSWRLERNTIHWIFRASYGGLYTSVWLCSDSLCHCLVSEMSEEAQWMSAASNPGGAYPPSLGRVSFISVLGLEPLWHGWGHNKIGVPRLVSGVWTCVKMSTLLTEGTQMKSYCMMPVSERSTPCFFPHLLFLCFTEIKSCLCSVMTTRGQSEGGNTVL